MRIYIIGIVVSVLFVIGASIYRYQETVKNGEIVIVVKGDSREQIEPLSKKVITLFADTISLTYLENFHALVDDTTRIPRIFIYEGRILEYVRTIDGRIVYLLPMTLADFLYEEIDGNNRIVNLPAIQNNVEDILFFVDAAGYYIRADLSYVCTQELLITATGKCHDESYYLD